ncbi:hypothetical protein FF38_06629, partial [Lucilia cuprina]
FDANCYISITRKLDTHDLSRGRTTSVGEALALIQQPVLVVGVKSDELFTFAEQVELQSYIKNSILQKIESQDGHDAFLLEFELINDYMQEFLMANLPDLMAGSKRLPIGDAAESLFGEQEITQW